jgi:predicted Fe-Mo cluster-binding NifX family protein
MRIAFSSEETTQDSQLDPRFGRAKYFQIYDDESKAWSTIDNVQNYQAPQGAGIQAASIVSSNNCQAVVTGHCGPKAFKALTAGGISIYLCDACTVIHAMERYKNNNLDKIDTPDVQGHW